MRMETIRNLIVLCRRQETHRSTTNTRCHLSREEKSSKATETPDNVKIDFSVPDKQMLLRRTFYCLLCRCDQEAGPYKLNKLFFRIDGLRKHVRIQHLEYMRPNEGFVCLYQDCMTSLKGTMHFLNYTVLEQVYVFNYLVVL